MIRIIAAAAALCAAPAARSAPPADADLADLDKLHTAVVAQARAEAPSKAEPKGAKKAAPKKDEAKADEPKKAEPNPRAEFAAALAKLDLAAAPLKTLDRLAKHLNFAPADGKFAAALNARVAKLAAGPGPDGAIAAALAVRTTPQPRSRAEWDAYDKTTKERIEAALHHRGFDAAFEAGDIPATFLATAAGSYAGDPMPKEVATKLASLATAERKLPAASLMALAQALAPRDLLPKAERDRLRELAIRAVEKARDDLGKSADKRRLKALDGQLAFLNGAALKGELLGKPAPETHFLWSNDSSGPRSLADFKGKVVAIDFWATWCGPCIGSFPEIKRMQERYADCPVVILSLTSPQGYVSYPKAKDAASRRKTVENEKDELDLLGPWVKEMEMTWTVACGKESCFNPDFGVHGIPHMAIVAPDGTVRFNGVNFRGGEAAPKIEALLREFKLPLPKAAADRKAG